MCCIFQANPTKTFFAINENHLEFEICHKFEIERLRGNTYGWGQSHVCTFGHIWPAAFHPSNPSFSQSAHFCSFGHLTQKWSKVLGLKILRTLPVRLTKNLTKNQPLELKGLKIENKI